MFAADIATMSSRGQVALPKDIRKAMNLKAGDKLLFVTSDNGAVVSKVERKTFEELTEPFRKEGTRIQESEVVDVIHALRKKWKKKDRS